MDSARAVVRSLTATRDARETTAVGRHARLELVFAVRRGRTVLTEAYAEPPFRVGRSFAEGAGLHMILVSSAPGSFGGDRLEQIIRLERGACVRLTSQSALQIHPASPASRDHSAADETGRPRAPAGPPAQVSSTYDVADGASLQCHWDPVIPFAGARFEQRIEIRLAGGASLYWSDAFMAGREGHGERWRFASLSHELRIVRAATLEYLERYRLQPADGRLTHPWVGGDGCYFGTTLTAGSTTYTAGAERVHAQLKGVDGLHAAADTLDADILVVRLMAGAGIPFHRARTLVRQMLT